MRVVPFLSVLIRCLELFFIYYVNMVLNRCVIINPATILKMQRFSLLGRIVNISVLGEKAVLRRNIFTTAGHGKGNGVPCITVGIREQEEVMNLKDFNTDGACQYIKKAVASSG
jgi:hypothetical protein